MMIGSNPTVNVSLHPVKSVDGGYEFIRSFMTSFFYIQYFISFYFSWSVPDN